MARLLVRDLAQLATPAGRSAPLRGEELGAVDVVEDAFVLCVDGRIEAAGRMRDLPGLEEDVEELDGRGLAAVPGLVDCHTHACFAGDRVEEFSLRAAGAFYEELHAGMVIVADGTDDAAARLERVLTADPGTGVMRHADAGYDRAIDVAKERGVDIPML